MTINFPHRYDENSPNIVQSISWQWNCSSCCCSCCLLSVMTPLSLSPSTLVCLLFMMSFRCCSISSTSFFLSSVSCRCSFCLRWWLRSLHNVWRQHEQHYLVHAIGGVGQPLDYLQHTEDGHSKEEAQRPAKVRNEQRHVICSLLVKLLYSRAMSQDLFVRYMKMLHSLESALRESRCGSCSGSRRRLPAWPLWPCKCASCTAPRIWWNTRSSWIIGNLTNVMSMQNDLLTLRPKSQVLYSSKSSVAELKVSHSLSSGCSSSTINGAVQLVSGKLAKNSQRQCSIHWKSRICKLWTIFLSIWWHIFLYNRQHLDQSQRTLLISRLSKHFSVWTICWLHNSLLIGWTTKKWQLSNH